MEAGYDYLLLRRKLQHKLFNYPAIFLVVFGALLLVAGGVYYGYATQARADLAELNVTAAEFGPATPGDKALDVPSISQETPVTEAIEIEAINIPPSISASVIAGQKVNTADLLNNNAWTNPLAYEPADHRQQALLQGFASIEADQAAPVGTHAVTTRLIIPEMEIDSAVNELAILNLGDSRAYETPVNEVGHIPASANGGEANSSWFFGHLESPIMGEGSVFYHLPQIANRLREGKAVHIIADNGDQQYLYRVTATEVVHQDDMRLSESGIATIHLVACVPRLVYDHRLIVTGELVGVK